jgi:hypothetical protein
MKIYFWNNIFLYCFGLGFGLILAIEILKKHMILALLDISIAFLAIYIYT